MTSRGGGDRQAVVPTLPRCPLPCTPLNTSSTAILSHFLVSQSTLVLTDYRCAILYTNKGYIPIYLLFEPDTESKMWKTFFFLFLVFSFIFFFARLSYFFFFILNDCLYNLSYFFLSVHSLIVS